jgi:hypothetical protein
MCAFVYLRPDATDFIAFIWRKNAYHNKLKNKISLIVLIFLIENLVIMISVDVFFRNFVNCYADTLACCYLLFGALRHQQVEQQKSYERDVLSRRAALTVVDGGLWYGGGQHIGGDVCQRAWHGADKRHGLSSVMHRIHTGLSGGGVRSAARLLPTEPNLYL